MAGLLALRVVGIDQGTYHHGEAHSHGSVLLKLGLVLGAGDGEGAQEPCAETH